MADKRISDFDNASALAGDELVALVQNEDNVKITLTEFIRQILGLSAEFVISVDCGEWDASGNLFPAVGGTGDGGVVERGNYFKIVGGGTLGESPVQGNQKLILHALYDNPLQDESKWKIY